MSIMFANTGSNSANASGNLLEFKAGRVLLQDGSEPNIRKCVPQLEKGLVYIKQTNDQLVHFCWKSRETNKTEVDLIVFPGDTEYLKIKEANRVYMLKFKTNTQHLLFWMQDFNATKDDENSDKVNDILNNPPAARTLVRSGGSERGSGTPSSALSSIANVLGASGDDIGALGTMDQSQIMQLLSLMNGNVPSDGYMPSLSYKPETSDTPVSTGRNVKKSSGGNSTTTGGSNIPVVDSNTLTAILNAIPSSGAAPSSSSRPFIDFSALLSRSNVQESVMANGERLQPHLPDQEFNNEPRRELEETVGNPQFRQAVDFFSHAFQTGTLAEALPHFGIKEDAVEKAKAGDIAGFAKKLTEQEQRSEKRASPSNSADPYDESGIVHETNESAAAGDPPKAKRGKTDENMDLD